MRAYDLDGLGRHNFEQIAEDLLKNHESIGWERRNYKQVMACAAGRGLADGSHGNRQRSRECNVTKSVQEAVIEQIKKKYYECMTGRRCSWGGVGSDGEQL